jgi:hypothetical protein
MIRERCPGRTSAASSLFAKFVAPTITRFAVAPGAVSGRFSRSGRAFHRYRYEVETGENNAQGRGHGIAVSDHRSRNLHVVRHWCSRIEIEHIGNIFSTVKQGRRPKLSRWLLFDVIASNLFCEGDAAHFGRVKLSMQRLSPTIDDVCKDYVLVQAWKKSANYIRYHNWFADTLELDYHTANLPDFLQSLSDEIRSAQDHVP